MTSLPAALRPWATQLSLFPEELVLSLGPHVARLSAALGALRPRGEASGGEPMGYDGLARRGTYERLLLTEWLYAEEAPEEFIRRAAFGEHAFLRPSFRQPQGARRSVALLDAGPDQLGVPRLAHLALLVVLARRAEAAGAAFEWAVLQGAPGGGSFRGLTVAGINAWLAARSAEPATGAHLATWREVLKLGHAPDDGWLVGPARLARFPEASGLSRVEVEEEVEVGLRRLKVQVRHATRAAREVALELPSADDCVRLLRDPFASRTVAPVKLAKAGGVRAVRFSGEGTRLLLLRSDGSVTVQAVPDSPRCTMPRPRHVELPAGHRLVAVDWRPQGGVVALTQHAGELLLSRGSLQGARSSIPPRYSIEQYQGRLPRPPSHEETPGQVLGLARKLEAGGERLLVCDGAGGVYVLAHPKGEASPAVAVAEKVVAFAEVRRKPVWVSVGPPGAAWGNELWLGIWEEEHLRHLPLGEGDGEVHFGYSESIGHAEAGLLAIRRQPGVWRVLLRQGYVDLSPPQGSRVVGVAVLPHPAEEPALVVLGEDRRTFTLVGKSETRTLPRATDDVAEAVVSHGLPVFAWRTVKGEVMVWSFKHSTVLYRSLPPEAA
jgi:hypothetical protein